MAGFMRAPIVESSFTRAHALIIMHILYLANYLALGKMINPYFYFVFAELIDLLVILLHYSFLVCLISKSGLTAQITNGIIKLFLFRVFM